MITDKHVLEHFHHAEKNFEWMKKHRDDIEVMAKASSSTLMRFITVHVKQPDGEAMVHPDSPVETMAKKLVKIYHQCARGVATLDIQADRIVVYAGRPRVELVGMVKVGYMFGRVQGLLGVCCECARAEEDVSSHLTPFYVRALLSASEASYEAWKAIVEKGEPVSTQDQLLHDLNHVVMSMQ